MKSGKFYCTQRSIEKEVDEAGVHSERTLNRLGEGKQTETQF